MRRPRFSVGTLLMIVAVVGAILGLFRFRRLSQQYAYQAWGYAGNVRMRVQSLAKAKAAYMKLRTDDHPDADKLEILGLTMQSLRAEIAANANLVQIYEHAASHPWEFPPEFAEAGKPDEHSMLVERLISSPQPPAPYNPNPGPPGLSGPAQILPQSALPPLAR